MAWVSRASVRYAKTLIVVPMVALLISCGGTSGDSTSETASDADVVEEPAPTELPTATEVPTATPERVLPVALNHIQVIGSHNSYHLRPTEALFAAIAGVSPDLAQSMEYSHRTLTEQLDLHGVRQFEIDVFADPDGGLYESPAANPLVGLPPIDDPVMLEPGFKVLHWQDFDYGTTCPTLVLCLLEIEAWSQANPEHLPIMIMIEYKSETIADAAADEELDLADFLPWTTPIEATPALLDALDAEIRSVFEPDQLIEPDDVRGDAATLEQAVLTTGWPSLDESRGQVLVTMTHGGEIRDL